MSNARLLSSQNSDDYEFSLNTVQSDRYFNNNNNNRASSSTSKKPKKYYHASTSSQDSNAEHDDDDADDDEDDMEAPPSLILDRQQKHLNDHHRQQQQYTIPQPPQQPFLSSNKNPSTREHMSTFDRTMWRWANVENMDDFFTRVYEYFQGKGIYCILLARLLNLLTLAFIIIFSTFLIGCINYSEITSHHKLGEVVEPQCLAKLSATKFLFLLIFIAWWIYQAIRFITDIPVLQEMHNFYTHLLLIPDQDMQTVSWQTILERIIDIRETNANISEQSPIKLTEHDVASRIMRKENYLIALFNKDALNFTIPLPYLKEKHIFTKDLEWNLAFCLLGFVFDNKGQIRKRFLREKNKHVLVAELKRRFIFMGLLNLVFAPFIFAYLLLHFFFRYFEEYHKNPGEIGSRAYSPFAKWKFREFNELPHLFRTRISQSYDPANHYINQFPKEKTILVARFISFLAGSFAGVLALLTLFDSEALLNFEITNNGTVLFYLGITGTLFAVTRGMIPDENQIFEPERLLRQVVEHTHYLPAEWKHRLHTDQVRAEFCLLFDYKVGIFLQELFSVVFAPLVLCWSLPTSANQIVDFFREFTVHVNGLGYVCSFAQFDFERHGNAKYGVEGAVVDDAYYLSNQGKMEKSFLNFKTNNPNWQPSDMAGSLYLSRLTRFKNDRYLDGRDAGIREEEDEEEERMMMGGSDNSAGSNSVVMRGHEDDDNEDQLSNTSSQMRRLANRRNQEGQQQHTYMNTFNPGDMNPSNIEYSEPSPPMKLNQYGIPDFIPSNLGDSFAHQERDEVYNNRQEEEEEENDGENRLENRREGMIGLLNQFYDLNNNPTV